MSLIWPKKGPDEIKDYSIDWAPKLAGDIISSSTWTVPTGVTKLSDTFSTTLTTIWLSGGSVGYSYSFLNVIITSGGRTYEQTVTLPVTVI